jgi:hypothetical protein
MVRFTADDDLRGAEIVGADLTGARFRFAELGDATFSQSYLPRAVMRGVDLTDADVDGMIGGLRLNGVEVAPLIEAELNRRYPGREHARSANLAEQRASFEAAQRTWAATLERVAAMPPGTADVSVDGEWSLAQTLRHLVMATDGWLRSGIQAIDDGAFHPIGVPFSEYDDEAPRLGIDMTATPSWEEILEVRADRVAQVRALYDALTQEEFTGPARRLPPWHGDEILPVWRSLGVIVSEEWEHHRFAERDLDRIERDRAGGQDVPGT